MRVLTTALVVLLLGAGGAAAATTLSQEQRDGRAAAAKVRAGDTSCADLSRADLDHVGEYVMARTLGSTATHRAMDARMTAVLGAAAAERMHQAMGARALGCTTGAAAGLGATAPMMGGAMMTGGAGPAWMADGRWRHMSRAQWQAMSGTWMGTHHDGHHGWSTLATVLVILAALAAAAVAGVAFGRRGIHGSPPGAPA